MSGIILPCLSIQQPWAWAILHAGKDYENRTWKNDFTGIFLIHTGKKIDDDGYEDIVEIMEKKKIFDHVGPLPTGGIVGIAEITGVTDNSTSDWFFGPYGYKIENPMELPFYPCKGKVLQFYDQEYPDREIIEHYVLTKGY